MAGRAAGEVPAEAGVDGALRSATGQASTGGGPAGAGAAVAVGANAAVASGSSAIGAQERQRLSTSFQQALQVYWRQSMQKLKVLWKASSWWSVALCSSKDRASAIASASEKLSDEMNRRSPLPSVRARPRGEELGAADSNV